MSAMRLNKFLASVGVASRRKADELIASGVVLVDRTRARPGQSIDPARNVVTVAGKRVPLLSATHVTLVLNKPAGIVTTMRDERGRPSVARLLPPGQRVFPVGRLDAETTGLLLFTSDGDLARALSHPSSEVPRTYRVTVGGSIDDSAIRTLQARSVRPNNDGLTTFDLTLREGKNRQVRRMCAQCGLRVVQLMRIAFGPIRLGSLAPGRIRRITQVERDRLDALLKNHQKMSRGKSPQGTPIK